MSIVRFENVSLAYGLKPLLDEVDFSIEREQRLCLLGRNGEGKSSMMRLIMRASEPDSGAIIFDKNLKIGFLPQDLPDADDQKAFDVVKPIENILKNIRGAKFETIETSCCGMAGSFGYDKDTYDISMKMANEKLFPAIKKSKGEITIIADGTSCRCQIKDGLNKEAIHIAKFLDQNIIY